MLPFFPQKFQQVNPLQVPTEMLLKMQVFWNMTVLLKSVVSNISKDLLPLNK
jgi:hypothetical protein